MHRGEIYRFRIHKGIGHEQAGPRYGVVVQSDAMLPRSTVLVAPTSLSAPAASFRPEVAVTGQKSKVLVEQVTAVDVSRLGKLVGRLAPDEMWDVDDALRTVLSLH